MTMAAGLPPELPAAVLVVLHMPATGRYALPRILDRSGALPAVAAVDGASVRNGRIYVAPPDRHLLLCDEMIRLSDGPRYHGHRPAADPLFRSAAEVAGARVLAVTLSGTLDDGAAGSVAVARAGGLVAVQEPRECAYDGMPRATLSAVPTAARVPVARLGEYIAEQSRHRLRGVPTRQSLER